MDPESLRVFCAVAAGGGITPAAQQLGRAPSGVTTRVQQLEAELGVELFVRSGKAMHLSSAGQRLLGYAQRLLSLHEEARQAVTGRDDGGLLRVGSMESTAASRLPGVLAGFGAAHPATRLEVSTGTSRALVERLRQGELDCAFAALPPGVELPGLASRPVWKEELLLAMPATDRARRVRDVRPRALAAFELGCAYRAIAEEALAMAGSTEWRVQEMGSYHAMLACVAAGGHVALVPRSVLALGGAEPGFHTLRIGYADTSLVWRQGYATPAFERFDHALPGGRS